MYRESIGAVQIPSIPHFR